MVHVTATVLPALRPVRRTAPWTAEEIAAAVDGLAAAGSKASVAELALLAALPASLAPSIAAPVRDGQVVLRGARADLSGDSTTVAVAVAALVERVALPEDHFTDPASDPVTWTRLIRSGVYRVLFGAEAVLGFPLVADPRVPLSAVYAYAHAAAVGAPLGRYRVRRVEFDVEGGLTGRRLQRHPRGPRPDAVAVDPARLSDYLATSFGAVALAAETVDDVDVTLHLWLDDHLIEVPSSHGALGYRGPLELTTEQLVAPVGFTPLGLARSGQVVAVHDVTRVRALISELTDEVPS